MVLREQDFVGRHTMPCSIECNVWNLILVTTLIKILVSEHTPSISIISYLMIEVGGSRLSCNCLKAKRYHNLFLYQLWLTFKWVFLGGNPVCHWISTPTDYDSDFNNPCDTRASVRDPSDPKNKAVCTSKVVWYRDIVELGAGALVRHFQYVVWWPLAVHCGQWAQIGQTGTLLVSLGSSIHTSHSLSELSRKIGFK